MRWLWNLLTRPTGELAALLLTRTLTPFLAVGVNPYLSSKGLLIEARMVAVHLELMVQEMKASGRLRGNLLRILEAVSELLLASFKPRLAQYQKAAARVGLVSRHTDSE